MHSPVTIENLEMKPQVLLYTRDLDFDGLLAEALSGTRTIVLIARTVADALQIVCQRGRELAFALMDFDGGCRGMTLLGFEQLPIVVTTSKDAEHATRRRSISSLVEIWIDEEFAKNGGRKPESVEVLPI